MIIEFAGLPGSGKSTVERLLTAALKEKGHLVHNRHEFRRGQTISHSVTGSPSNRLIRKSRTMFYWISLIAKTLYTHPEYVVGLMENRLHTIRATARVYDDHDIIQRYISPGNASDTLNISEGLYHHLVAMNVWRSFYRQSVSVHIPRSILTFLTSVQGLVLIKTQMNVEAAKQRLTSRGIPSAWPTRLDPSYVLDKFAYYDRLLSDSGLLDSYKVFAVDTSEDFLSLPTRVDALVTNLIEVSNQSGKFPL